MASGCPSLLAQRLRQRNFYVRERNQIPRVFIGSSSEQKRLAECVGESLCDMHTVVAVVWSDIKRGIVFKPSVSSIDNLVNQVRQCDFAVMIAGADDITISRKHQVMAPRDNVVFEIGLFMGALGPNRVLVLRPVSKKSPRLVKIPSDLEGLTLLNYPENSRLSSREQVKEACGIITKVIQELGCR